MRPTWNGFLRTTFAGAMLFAALGVGLTRYAGADTPTDKERFVTVTVGDTTVRCKVLVSWNLTNAGGGQAFQVKAVETGDMLTIVRESRPEAGAKEANVRVYRWKDAATPHPSAPKLPPFISTLPPKDNAPTIIVPNSTPIVTSPTVIPVKDTKWTPPAPAPKASTPSASTPNVPLPTITTSNPSLPISQAAPPKVNWAELAKPAGSPGLVGPELSPLPIQAPVVPQPVAPPTVALKTPAVTMPKLPIIIEGPAVEKPVPLPVVTNGPQTAPVPVAAPQVAVNVPIPPLPTSTPPAAKPLPTLDPATIASLPKLDATLVLPTLTPETTPAPQTAAVVDTRAPFESRMNVVSTTPALPDLGPAHQPVTTAAKPVAVATRPVAERVANRSIPMPTIDRSVDVHNQSPWAKGDAEQVQPGKMTLETWMGEPTAHRPVVHVEAAAVKNAPVSVASLPTARPTSELPTIRMPQPPVAVDPTRTTALPTPRHLLVAEEPVAVSTPALPVAPAERLIVAEMPVAAPSAVQQPAMKQPMPPPTAPVKPMIVPAVPAPRAATPINSPINAPIAAQVKAPIRTPMLETNTVIAAPPPPSSPTPGMWQKKSLFEQLRNKLSWLAPNADDEALPYVARGQMSDERIIEVADPYGPAHSGPATYGPAPVARPRATLLDRGAPVYGPVSYGPVSHGPAPTYAPPGRQTLVDALAPATYGPVRNGYAPSYAPPAGRQTLVDMFAPVRRPAPVGVNRTLTYGTAQQQYEEAAAASRPVPMTMPPAYDRNIVRTSHTQPAMHPTAPGFASRKTLVLPREIPQHPVEAMPVVQRRPSPGFDRTLTLVGAQSAFEESQYFAAPQPMPMPQRFSAGDHSPLPMPRSMPQTIPMPQSMPAFVETRPTAAMPIVAPPTVATMPTPVGYPVYPIPAPNTARPPMGQMREMPQVVVEAPPVVRTKTLASPASLTDMLGLNGKRVGAPNGDPPMIVAQPPTHVAPPTSVARPSSCPTCPTPSVSRPTQRPTLVEMLGFNGKSDTTMRTEYVFVDERGKATTVPPGPLQASPRSTVLESLVANKRPTSMAAEYWFESSKPMLSPMPPPMAAIPKPLPNASDRPPASVANLMVTPTVAPVRTAAEKPAAPPAEKPIAPPPLIVETPPAPPVARPMPLPPAPVVLRREPPAKIVKTEPTAETTYFPPPSTESKPPLASSDLAPPPLVKETLEPKTPAAPPAILTPPPSTMLASPPKESTETPIEPASKSTPLAPTDPAPTPLAPMPALAQETPPAPMPAPSAALPPPPCDVCSTVPSTPMPVQPARFSPLSLFGLRPKSTPAPMHVETMAPMSMPAPAACDVCSQSSCSPGVVVDDRMSFQNRLRSLLGMTPSSPYSPAGPTHVATNAHKETIILLSETIDGVPVSPLPAQPVVVTPAAPQALAADLLPPPDKVMVVSVGDQRMKCKVVVSWTLPNGGHAYQVRIVDTGEMVTVVRELSETGASKQVAARVFRWHGAQTSPEGAPVPPIVLVKSAPCAEMPKKIDDAKEPKMLPKGEVETAKKIEIPKDPPKVEAKVMPASYVTLTIPANPAMDRPKQLIAVPNFDHVALAQLMAAAKDSPSPAQRELAVLGMAKYGVRTHPQVVDFLGKVAANDRAPAVRASALAVLVRLNAPREAVAATVNLLREDGDVRVRQAVADATATFRLEP